MPLYLFYTIVQKSKKSPKTQIKGGPALKSRLNLVLFPFPYLMKPPGETSQKLSLFFLYLY